mgnify:CR=1 FL=1
MQNRMHTTRCAVADALRLMERTTFNQLAEWVGVKAMAIRNNTPHNNTIAFVSIRYRCSNTAYTFSKGYGYLFPCVLPPPDWKAWVGLATN